MGALRDLLHLAAKIPFPVSLLAAPVIVVLALAWPRFGNSWFTAIEARLQSLARHKRISMLLLALLPVALRLALLPVEGVPVPFFSDEFGHLLVADTLLHGRLANPPHPYSEFFESTYVILSPTYSSYYPAGNGIMLAIGRVLFGRPWGGVLLFIGLMCAAVYWMLLGWTTPGWALLGGALTVINWGIVSNWANSYWGGQAAALGGCLALGSLPRLTGKFGERYAFLLGIGISYAFLIRPYETLVLAPCLLAFALLYRDEFRAIRMQRALLLLALGLAPGAIVTVAHNRAVTGDFTKLPYVLYQEQYGVPQPFVFQAAATPSRPLTPQQEAVYHWQRKQHDARGLPGVWFEKLLRDFKEAFDAYLGSSLVPLLFALPFCRFSRKPGWVAGTAAFSVFASSFYGFFFFHYLAALIGLFLLVGFYAMDRLNAMNWGRTAVRLFLVLAICHFGVLYLVSARGTELLTSAKQESLFFQGSGVFVSTERSRVLHHLLEQGGKHVVFVKYGNHHDFNDEWVYNAADLDHSPVVWACDLGSEKDRLLMDYYPDRSAWRVEVDTNPPQLTRLR